MAEKSLDDLFQNTLKDIYYAERKILTTLPKMIKAAQSPELKGAFEKHRQTEVHVERLVEILLYLWREARRQNLPRQLMVFLMKAPR